MQQYLLKHQSQNQTESLHNTQYINTTIINSVTSLSNTTTPSLQTKQFFKQTILESFKYLHSLQTYALHYANTSREKFKGTRATPHARPLAATTRRKLRQQNQPLQFSATDRDADTPSVGNCISRTETGIGSSVSHVVRCGQLQCYGHCHSVIIFNLLTVTFIYEFFSSYYTEPLTGRTREVRVKHDSSHFPVLTFTVGAG